MYRGSVLATATQGLVPTWGYLLHFMLSLSLPISLSCHSSTVLSNKAMKKKKKPTSFQKQELVYWNLHCFGLRKGQFIPKSKHIFFLLLEGLFIHFSCLVLGVQFWRYQLWRCLPSPEYDGSRWHSACGATKIQLEKHDISVSFQISWSFLSTGLHLPTVSLHRWKRAFTQEPPTRDNVGCKH